MSDLIKAYGHFGNFSEERYFTYRFNEVPSALDLTLPHERTPESFQRVLALIDIDELGLEVVRREWMIGDQKEAGEEPVDYVNEALFVSETFRMCVNVGVRGSGIHLEFLYDAKHPEAETRALQQLQRLRHELSEPKMPTFQVLIQERGSITSQNVQIDPFDVDLARNYNDDLIPVDQLISEAIEKQNSGLILFHGIPGTGKTSYLKSLISRYPDERFVFIPNDFVQAMLQPHFLNYLMDQRNAIFIIEDAEKVIRSRESSGGSPSVVSTILQITDGLFSDFLNIKIVCTFNTDVSKIDQALLRKGRMIAYYEFGELSVDKALKIVESEGRKDLPEVRTLAELYNLDKEGYEGGRKASIGFR